LPLQVEKSQKGRNRTGRGKRIPWGGDKKKGFYEGAETVPPAVGPQTPLNNRGLWVGNRGHVEDLTCMGSVKRSAGAGKTLRKNSEKAGCRPANVGCRPWPTPRKTGDISKETGTCSSDPVDDTLPRLEHFLKDLWKLVKQNGVPDGEAKGTISVGVKGVASKYYPTFPHRLWNRTPGEDR